MAEQLDAGVRSMPTRGAAALGFGASHTAWTPPIDPMSSEAVRIDWAGTQRVAPSRSAAAAAAKAGNWQDRFVNHLGSTSERMNPNAALRLHLPTGSSLTAGVAAR